MALVHVPPPPPSWKDKFSALGKNIWQKIKRAAEWALRNFAIALMIAAITAAIILTFFGATKWLTTPLYILGVLLLTQQITSIDFVSPTTQGLTKSKDVLKKFSRWIIKHWLIWLILISLAVTVALFTAIGAKALVITAAATVWWILVAKTQSPYKWGRRILWTAIAIGFLLIVGFNLNPLRWAETPPQTIEDPELGHQITITPTSTPTLRPTSTPSLTPSNTPTPTFTPSLTPTATYIPATIIPQGIGIHTMRCDISMQQIADAMGITREQLSQGVASGSITQVLLPRCASHSP